MKHSTKVKQDGQMGEAQAAHRQNYSTIYTGPPYVRCYILVSGFLALFRDWLHIFRALAENGKSCRNYHVQRVYSDVGPVSGGRTSNSRWKVKPVCNIVHTGDQCSRLLTRPPSHPRTSVSFSPYHLLTLPPSHPC